MSSTSGVEFCDKNCTIQEIIKIQNELKRDNAVLSLKCEKITFWNNLIQINAIIFSTLVSFLESVKSIYNLNSKVFVILPIILTSYVGVSLSIIRFMKLTDKVEELVKLSERFSFIIKKLRKVKKDIETSEGIELEKNISLYEQEVYEYYVSTREIFDNSINFNELVTLKKKFLVTFKNYKYIQNRINAIATKDAIETKIIEVPWWKYYYDRYICFKKPSIEEIII